MKLTPITTFAVLLAITSCGTPAPTPADVLLDRLETLVDEGKIMFGHQDDYMYGHSWRLADNAVEYVQSDTYASCGRYPAVYGMDLGGVEMDWHANLDGNPFSHMRASAVAHHERGGVVTFSWHLRNPLTGGDSWDVSSDQVVASILPGGEKHELFMGWLSNAADFLESLKTADGETVPVIFRPWHEHTGSWFWWGQKLCTADQYKALWRLTFDYMTGARGLTNILWAYSPGAGDLKSPDVFGERYPGDDIIDIVGFDCYEYAGNKVYAEDMTRALDITAAFAEEHDKIMAITETGYEGIKDPKWWTGVLYPVMKDYPVSYVLVWRNACEPHMQHHFYGPHPDHDSVEDFRAFADLEQILLL